MKFIKNTVMKMHENIQGCSKNNLLTVSFYIFTMLMFMLLSTVGYAQEENEEIENKREKKEKEEQVPVRNMFNSNLIIDNQTVIVPSKGTFEWDIQHRFGTFTNGYDDFWGLFASSNIRLGFSYVPVKNLQLGFGITKWKQDWDFNVKYAILQQSRSGRIPISITYFGNMVIDGRTTDKRDEIYNGSDRLSYFHQIIFARKFHEYFSMQIAPSLSHYNITDEYMKNDHIALAVGFRVKLTNTLSALINYDQPLTKHTTGNPDPNVSIGLEVSTSSHAFQIFIGNYYNLVPQENNYFNTYSWLPDDGEKWGDNWLIGFNISRLWNF
jgi:hypothetical protein